MASNELDSRADHAWVVTGPTSGIGRRAALALAPSGTLVLVGRRSPAKLSDLEREVTAKGGSAISVVGDLADLESIRSAAAEIAERELPLAGLLNNAGIMTLGTGTSAQGFDLSYATNHLGPFALTEALLPHLRDNAHVVFVCSAVEDPERRPAVMAGFRGGRYVSAEASARGEWLPGGSKRPGLDAYATSKQGNLATVLSLSRETSRVRFSAVEPGFSPGSDLGREAGAALTLVSKYLMSPLAPMIKYWSTPKRAGRMIARIMVDDALPTGGYYDENGRPMVGSKQVQDPAFQDRVVAETRALLAAHDALEYDAQEGVAD